MHAEVILLPPGVQQTDTIIIYVDKNEMKSNTTSDKKKHVYHLHQ